jgi:hypothetical protein
MDMDAMPATYDGPPPTLVTDAGLGCTTPNGLPVRFNPMYSGYAKADRLKASTVDWIEKTYRNHLYPALGDKRLVDVAHGVDARAHLVVLLGGDAGLRRGEMMALRWRDVDFKRRQLQVQESVWERKRPNGDGHERITDSPRAAGRASCVLPMRFCKRFRSTVTCAANTCCSAMTAALRRAFS